MAESSSVDRRAGVRAPVRAALPMYDIDRAAVHAWWLGLATALRAEGLGDLPARLRWPTDLDRHWAEPGLLLSQTCGMPLVTSLAGRVSVVGAFHYAAPGCTGIEYRSELVVRDNDNARTVDDLRQRVATFNDPRSHSGCNALRALVAPLARDGRFFSRTIRSGSHRASLALVRSGRADIAAVDCVSLAALRQRIPAEWHGLRVLGSTAPAPGLPLITSGDRSAAEVEALRRGLGAACADPALATVRERLGILGFERAIALDWERIETMRVAGAGLLDFEGASS
jgi:ABC-type phosphate/phosphonate transport system substrate-binding protein